MSQFDHESDDQSALANELVRELARKDRVVMEGGISTLPREFREVVRLANRAGLEGFQAIDVSVGPDIEAYKNELKAFMTGNAADEPAPPKCVVLITYRRKP